MKKILILLITGTLFSEEPMVDISGNNIYTICVHDDTNLYDTANDNSNNIIGKSSYNDTFCVIDIQESDDGIKFYKVSLFEECSPVDATAIGWIKETNLLLWEFQDEYYAPDGYIPIQESAILVKGLIKTDFKEKDKTNIRAGAKRYTKPFFPIDSASDDYSAGDELILDEIYYVYDVEKHGDYDGEVWYLLGRHTWMVDPFKPEDTILGWVKKDRVFIWNTRNAFEFDKTTLPTYDADGDGNIDKCDDCRDYARIFANIEDIEEVLIGSIDKEERTLFKEKADQLEVKPDDSRIFIIDDDWVDSGNYKVYNVGMFSDAFKGDGTGLSAVQNITDYNIVDILFVYDGTGSMREMSSAVESCISSAQEKISEIWENAYKGDDGIMAPPQIRCSIAMYKDGYYCPEDVNSQKGYSWKQQFDYFTYKPLGDVNNNADLVNFIQTHSFTGGCSSPALLNGIATSIEYNADVLDNTSLRIMVLIGDMGNNFFAGTDNMPDRFGHTVESVAKSLSDENIVLYTYNMVNQNYHNMNNDYAEVVRLGSQAFKSDFDNIKSNFIKINPSKDGYLNYYECRVGSDGTSPDLSKNLSEMIDYISRTRFEITKFISDLENINTNVASGGFITQYGLDLMKQNGIDYMDFVNSSTPPFIDDAYLFQYNPNLPDEKYFKEVLLLSRDEIVDLHALYSKLTQKFDRSNMEAIWTSTLGTSIGEKVSDDATYQELLQAHRGLPTVSKLLSMSINEIRKMPNKEFFKEMNIIKQKTALLWSVLEERDVEIILDENGNMESTKTLGNKKFFFGRQGNKKTWLDANKYIP